MKTCSFGIVQENVRLESLFYDQSVSRSEGQIKAWPEHKGECGRIQEEQKNTLEHPITTEEQQLVHIFNALPIEKPTVVNRSKIPSHFHIDIRYVPLPPSGYLLLACNPHTSGVLVSKINFDPTSTAAKTAELLCISLLQLFCKPRYGCQTPCAPSSWSMSSEDATLAREMEKRFKCMKMRQELTVIGETSEVQMKTAEESWVNFFNTLRDVAGGRGKK
ncbi:hypothetical protein PROFUN_04694 [Planoprotostelium fungivorum]|uniref:Uncharacterized protein n=1 Tax=Planoprotostelium fungivorum TaxID=1890364 RepID=A0A2P6NFY0_9EUKA|nr:hypothetical protein PROFUN_04694 [Planoprotostelium fungivorum]